jgi:hypothetical protein
MRLAVGVSFQAPCPGGVSAQPGSAIGDFFFG